MSGKGGDLLIFEPVTFDRPMRCQVGKRICKSEAEERSLEWRCSL